MVSTEGAAQIRTLASEILLEDGYRLDGPLTQEGLSVIPIVSVEDDEIQETEYINAAEALENKTLRIIEGGDQVSTIIAENIGQIPILIEEGEVLVGQGSQDRIVVSSVLIQPGERTRIPVKCVHAPHSLMAGAEFSSMGLCSTELREVIKRTKYESIMTDVDHYTPQTAVGQDEVWDKAGRYGDEAGVDDRTEYTKALAKRRKAVKAAAKKLRKLLPEDTCGIIVIDSKGDICAIEIYRSSRAFKKRKGIIESLLMTFTKEGDKPQEREAAWSKAIQVLMKLQEIASEEVIVQDGSDNIHLQVEELTGEAITGEVRDKKAGAKKAKAILYFSLGTTE